MDQEGYQQQQRIQMGFAPRRQYDMNRSGSTGGGAEAGSGNYLFSKVDKEKPENRQLAEPPAADKAYQFGYDPDVNGKAMKTPVSVLQELLGRRGIAPVYELVDIEGAIHQPTFRFQVSFRDNDTLYAAIGAGRSKKEAKHAAARALINQIIGVQSPESQSSGVMGSSADDNAHGPGARVVSNPIGWLQEMCMQRRWPPPSYETEDEVGLPHERMFTISCAILNYREVGKGQSKKMAKRLAAENMWNRLQETFIDAARINDSIRSELEEKNTLLKSTNLDYLQLLGEVAAENQLEVTYMDIDEKIYPGQFQCLVKLSTLPVGVCHGTGPTAQEAQRVAAQNALEYLKIIANSSKFHQYIPAHTHKHKLF